MIHTLEADGIQLEFNGRKILSDIYIKCETGKITGLLGRNGQGKSCLMKIIYGSMSCEKSVRVNRVSQPEAFKRPDLIRYLPQFNFIPRSFSLKKIFNDFELEFKDFSKRFPVFSSAYHKPIDSLSGGLSRVVELYIIVTSNAQFVMLDEPFTHLSPVLIEQVKELLVEAKAKKGLLISDHIYRQVIGVSDNLYVLTNGKIQLTKTEADLERLGYARL